MKIKVKNKTYYSMLNNNKDWVDKMNTVAGKWIEVDTEYLFSDQFNTPAGDGQGSGLRILLKDIEAIKDDMRPYRKICRWCHHHSALVDKKCCHCGKTEYFERLIPWHVNKKKRV